jgi:hypothetical protein
MNRYTSPAEAREREGGLLKLLGGVLPVGAHAKSPPAVELGLHASEFCAGRADGNESSDQGGAASLARRTIASACLAGPGSTIVTKSPSGVISFDTDSVVG